MHLVIGMGGQGLSKDIRSVVSLFQQQKLVVGSWFQCCQFSLTSLVKPKWIEVVDIEVSDGMGFCSLNVLRLSSFSTMAILASPPLPIAWFSSSSETATDKCMIN